MSLFELGPADHNQPRDIYELLASLETQASVRLADTGLSTDAAFWNVDANRNNELEWHSPEKYAASILAYCYRVREALAVDDAPSAAWLTASLMSRAAQANLDLKEKPIKHGVKNLKKLDHARGSRKRKIAPADVPEIKKEIDRLCRRKELSITEIRRQIGTKYGAGEKAIRTATEGYNPRK